MITMSTYVTHMFKLCHLMAHLYLTNVTNSPKNGETRKLQLNKLTAQSHTALQI